MAFSTFSLLSFFCFVNALIQASLLLADTPAPPPPPPGSLIQHVCSHHSNPKYCFDQLHNDSEGRISGLFGLGRVGIRLAKARADDTSHIKSLLGTVTDQKSKECLTNCLSDYGEASDALDEASVDLGERDYSKVNVDASAAEDYGSDCEDRFGTAKVSSPITADNQALQDLSEIVEIVANMLLNGEGRRK